VTFAITGANGFLGVHIIHHLLKQGHTVRAIIRAGASLAEFHKVKEFYNLVPEIYAMLTWYECVLYDIEGLKEVFSGVDYSMHLAGVISYLGKDFNRLLEVNQQYTANVVNVAKDAGVKKLLYCSSIAAIAKSGKEDRITESAEWDDELPHSNYGYSKHLGELELWRGAEEGLATVAINPGIILGYGDWTKGSNKLFGNAQKGFPFYSNGITGWVGVEDVARIAIKLCTSDIVGERFIVVAENKSFKEVSDRMTNALGTKKAAIEIKGLLYKIAYYLIAFKEFIGLGGMLSRETVKASIAVNRFDNTKVKKALDFDFEDIEEVISKAV
jgi:nucleoside-diphosphate-sugar epimerase